MDVRLTDKQSIPAVLREMTLEEKAGLVTGASPFYTRSLERLGIPAALLLDGGTGVNFMQLYIELLYQAENEKRENETEPAKELADATGLEAFAPVMRILPHIGDPDALEETDRILLERAAGRLEAMKPQGKSPGCFPPGMLLGATWDPDTVFACAEALGREAGAYQIDVLLGTPNVNLHRDPLNGRLFEGYSEDPCLVAGLAPHFVRGVQKEGVAANVKHFAANNQETGRMGIDEHIPVRALHELYFPGFKACVQAGQVKTVMSAYNKINGRACAMNSWLLTDILRGEWGFSGCVMSDWGAAYDQVEAAEAGNDLVMPGPRSIRPLAQAVRSGRLAEAVLDRCASNFLALLLETPVMQGRRHQDIDAGFSWNAAYRAAAEGAVLLKNRGGILPLRTGAKVGFFGDKCKKFIESGGGSAEVWTDLSTNLYDAAAAKIGGESVSFNVIGKDADVVIVTAGAKGQEGADRPGMDLDESDRIMLLQAVAAAKAAEKPVVVVLNVAGPVHMMDWIDDADAVLCVFLPGMAGGQVAADILFGDINPSGKLPLTFPKYYRDCPTYGNFPGEFNEVWYGEGIFVGYRYYDFKAVEPLYPFGFGLSYTTFELSDLRLSAPTLSLEQGGPVQVRVKIRNVGRKAGKEVVQLYVAHGQSRLLKPPKELKAFRKVALEPGETKDIELILAKDDLASYDVTLNRWVTEPGACQVLIGRSSRDIVLRERLLVV